MQSCETLMQRPWRAAANDHLDLACKPIGANIMYMMLVHCTHGMCLSATVYRCHRSAVHRICNMLAALHVDSNFPCLQFTPR